MQMIAVGSNQAVVSVEYCYGIENVDVDEFWQKTISLFLATVTERNSIQPTDPNASSIIKSVLRKYATCCHLGCVRFSNKCSQFNTVNFSFNLRLVRIGWPA